MNATDRGAMLMDQRGGPPQDPQAEYADVRRRIHGLVGTLTDRGSTVAVVSKGDQELVRFDTSEGWHFPRTPDGKYAGHHPADAAEVIAHLEQLRQQGADHFLLPSTYFWWLEHYQGLAQHLQSRYRLVADCPDTCLIYDMRRPAAASARVPASRPVAAASTNGAGAPHPLVPAIRTVLDGLLPEREPVLVVSEGQDELLQLGRRAQPFPRDLQDAHRSSDSVGESEIAAQLAAARTRGLRYLVVPDTARHRVEPSGVLHDPLRKQARELAFREGVCTIYELDPTEGEPARSARRSLRSMLGGARRRADE